MLSPLQPFRVRQQAPLSQLQQVTLRQCYQPVIGTVGLAFYLSLTDYAGADGAWSPAVMHASLIDQLQVSPADLNQARGYLEALGLLKSYQPKKVQGNAQTQLVSYEVIAPLEVGSFLQHPLYAALLMNKIGDQAFYRLMRRFEWEEMDASEYVEVTQSFSQVFDYPSDQAIKDAQNQDALSGSYRQQTAPNPAEASLDQESQDSFRYGRVLDILEAAQVNSRLFTRELRQQMASLHQVYGFNEEQVATVIKLAYQDQTEQIAMDQLPSLAKRYKDSLSSKESAANQAGQLKDQIQARAQTLREQGQYSNNQAQIIATAEILPPLAFLKQVKQAKGGIRSDQEGYNLEAALDKVKLSPAIVNLAVYYLLVMEGRDHLYKSNFEKLLDEWQQKGIKEVHQVFRYIEDKRQAQAKKASQESGRPYGRTHKGSGAHQRQEVVPSWLAKQRQAGQNSGQASKQAQPETSPTASQATQTFVNPFKKGSAQELDH